MGFIEQADETSQGPYKNIKGVILHFMSVTKQLKLIPALR
jgi:hypothetical protein